MDNYIIEIATSDFETTKAAVEGGADRIELCANLVKGGTTPSYGLIKACREAFEVAIYPIIRPRGGDFLYTEAEFRIMLQDIGICKSAGCEGIVIGLLTEDGAIDMPRMKIIMQAAYPMEVTFHRAFDRCADPFDALQQLIDLGCERLLTSGQQPAAPDGVAMIRELITAAENRIIIMPGSGVRKENIRMLAEQTGAREFHSSLRGKTKSRMRFIHPAFSASAESYENNFIDPAEVTALRQALS